MYLESPARAGFRALLRNRDLLLLLGAGLVSQVGDWILGTGVAFEVYVLTGSTLASATVLLATQLPQVLVGSMAGVLVDRWDRRRTMIAVNVALAVVLMPLLVVHAADQVWLVVAVTAASSALAPFFAAAEVALVPALVPAGRLVEGNALIGQVRNVARLIGAALGGLIVATGGLAAVAVVDAATFVIAAGLLLGIGHRAAPAATTPLRLGRDWMEGVRAIRGSRALIAVLVMFALAGVGEAVMGTLFAPFVHDVLHGTGEVYGAVLAAQAVGGIAGGLAVTAVGHRIAPRALFGWGAVVFGFIDLLLFLSPLAVPTVWPAVVLIALVGLPGAAFSAGMFAVLQTSSADAVRGRVFGALTAVQNSTMLIGTVLAGALAGLLGIVPVIVVQGLVYVLGGVVVLVVLADRRRPA